MRRHAEPSPKRTSAARGTPAPRGGAAGRVPSLPRSSSNQLLSRRILARKGVKFDGKKLSKDERLPFEYGLEQAMGVGDKQHRAHVISYDVLVRGVMDPINTCLAAGDTKSLPYVAHLINAVFPGGNTKLYRHTDAALAKIAFANHDRARAAYAKIETILSQKAGDLAKEANELIGALNNSPDNLRVGAGDTNSSIQEALDLQPTGTQVLKKGKDQEVTALPDRAVDNTAKPKTAPVQADLTVLRVNQLDEWMVWELLTTTRSDKNALHLYSSGRKLQSSDYPGMKSATMKSDNPTHLSILVPGSSDVYFLFTLPA
jgi:hypothetical protein